MLVVKNNPTNLSTTVRATSEKLSMAVISRTSGLNKRLGRRARRVHPLPSMCRPVHNFRLTGGLVRRVGSFGIEPLLGRHIIKFCTSKDTKVASRRGMFPVGTGGVVITSKTTRGTITFPG